jgi:hypothetical protein
MEDQVKAFPRDRNLREGISPEEREKFSGMDLRDAAALAALPTVLNILTLSIGSSGVGVDVAAEVAETCYEIADAMMRAREKRPKAEK